MKEKNSKYNKGITLVALVITIIVLIILAGVSINLVLGENGIFKKAIEAREETEKGSKEEKRQLAIAEALMNEEKTVYNGVTIPAGFAPTRIEGENTVEKGLVIIDGEGNSYVWIPVPKTNEVYATATTQIKTFTEEDYSKIETDLKKYVVSYQKTGYSDQWYNGCGIETSEEYNSLKKKMLKSIYENGGFWIGQYEMGTETPRESHSEDLPKAVCREGAYPYIYINLSEAQQLATKMSDKDYTTSLLFGIQWDLVLKFMEINGGLTENQLNVNSKDWGNYRSANFSVTKGSYMKYSNGETRLDSKDRVWKKVEDVYEKGYDGVYLTTGATTRNSILNIFDFAGNVREYTLETYPKSTSSSYCISRSGFVFDWTIGAGVRNGYAINTGSDTIGFRITIF